MYTNFWYHNKYNKYILTKYIDIDIQIHMFLLCLYTFTHLGPISQRDLDVTKFLAKSGTFSSILKKLRLSQSNITFHSLRRSGATLAFNSSVPIQDIQSHGTWTSECVWSYITQDHQASDKVALAFQQLLQP